MTRRTVKGVVLGIGVALVALAIAAAAGSRSATLRALVVQTLAERLESDVELESFSVDTFPSVRIQGAGLVIRHRGRRDVPPLVAIRSFSLEGGLLGILSRPRRFRSVELVGLQVNIPPGGFSRGAGEQPGHEPGPDRERPGTAAIVVERIVAEDATLVLIPRQAGKAPREFAVHRLTIEGVGRGEPMPFEAAITNPIPEGMVLTTGTFGPWQKGEPGRTPLSGAFTFNEVDLSTIKGIGGTLDSDGTFAGVLERIEVEGRTSTPDFRVNVAGNPVPLRTSFQAVVDGTDGDTHLTRVAASLRDTSLLVSGAVVGQEGVKGRAVKVSVSIDGGRIQDVLQLAVKGERPVMTGRLGLRADLNLPPGQADVMDRLEVAGDFTVAAARFTDPEVQARVADMSERASGAGRDVADASVMSNLAGRFRLARSGLTLPDARFGIPGARVQVAGRYGLKDEALEFDGTLRMDATVSQAAGGGVKSVLLKAVDPLFRRDGSGAVIPIKVRGNRANPEFGLNVGRALRRR